MLFKDKGSEGNSTFFPYRQCLKAGKLGTLSVLEKVSQISEVYTLSQMFFPCAVIFLLDYSYLKITATSLFLQYSFIDPRAAAMKYLFFLLLYSLFFFNYRKFSSYKYALCYQAASAIGHLAWLLSFSLYRSTLQGHFNLSHILLWLDNGQTAKDHCLLNDRIVSHEHRWYEATHLRYVKWYSFLLANIKYLEMNVCLITTARISYYYYSQRLWEAATVC